MFDIWSSMLPYVLMVISQGLYNRRVRKKPEGLKGCLIKQWIILIVVAAFLILSVDMAGLQEAKNELLFGFKVMFLCNSFFTLWNLLFISRDEAAADILSLLREQSIVMQKDCDMIKARWIKTKDFPDVKAHVATILHTIQEEAPGMPKESLEFVVGRRRGCYCVDIEYFYLVNGVDEFEEGRQLLGNALLVLDKMYNIEQESGTHWQRAKIYLTEK